MKLLRHVNGCIYISEVGRLYIKRFTTRTKQPYFNSIGLLRLSQEGSDENTARVASALWRLLGETGADEETYHGG